MLKTLRKVMHLAQATKGSLSPRIQLTVRAMILTLRSPRMLKILRKVMHLAQATRGNLSPRIQLMVRAMTLTLRSPRMLKILRKVMHLAQATRGKLSPRILLKNLRNRTIRARTPKKLTARTNPLLKNQKETALKSQGRRIEQIFHSLPHKLCTNMLNTLYSLSFSNNHPTFADSIFQR